MKKPNLAGIAKGIGKSMKKHSPEILTGIGIAGMIVTTVMAVKATPEALKSIEAEKRKQNRENMEAAKDTGEECARVEKLTPIETVKIAWKPYAPAAVTGVASVACLIGASKVNLRRNAALATAYSLSETALKEYQAKTTEIVGEKKEQSIRDAIAKDKVEQNPVENNEVIVMGKGETRCFDAAFGRYFMSDIDKLRKVENLLNKRLIDEMYISLNDFYYEIGLIPVDSGDDIGWNIDDGMIEFHYSSQLSSDGVPCLVVSYSIAPRYDYRHLH